MNSKILGTTKLEENLLQEDINKILKFKFDNQYSDFYANNWTISILQNKTGSKEDFKLEDYKGKAKPTEFGIQLDYINKVIENTFNTDYIKWVRIFRLDNGTIIPHIDYSKLEKDFIRIHIPLQTNLSCLGSNQNTVFHMKKGEIWFLDAANVHSGANFSDNPRLTLCIDFSPDITVDKIFKDKSQYKTDIKPYLIKRLPVDEEYIETLKALGGLIKEENFNDILMLLAKEHFFRDVSGASIFDWLIDITKHSKNEALIEKAIFMKKYYLKI